MTQTEAELLRAYLDHRIRIVFGGRLLTYTSKQRIKRVLCALLYRWTNVHMMRRDEVFVAYGGENRITIIDEHGRMY